MMRSGWNAIGDRKQEETSKSVAFLQASKQVVYFFPNIE